MRRRVQRRRDAAWYGLAVIASCRRDLRAVCFGIGLLASPALAQYGQGSTEAQPNNYPPALPARHGPAPELVFELVGEVALPGPLGTSPAWVSDNRVAVPVDGGVARVVPEPGALPTLGPAEPAPTRADWIVAPSGTRRYRATAEGIVEAQRWSSTRKRWVRRWKIVAPNSLLAMPVLLGPRLCYAGLDDRVTCVRASNGHRLWAVDLGDRLSHPMARWPAASEAPPRAPAGDRAVEGTILLVVPDDGATVIALDAFDGRRVASYNLPPNHRFASSALVLDGDRIALARKGYDDREASLILLRLAPAPKAVTPEPVPYNGPSPVPAGSPGR
jgi:hypothetical protein